MSRSAELDLLNSDTHSQLDDVSITVHQNRPESAIDPDTRLRTIDVGALNTPVNATEGIDTKINNNGRWVRVRSWFVDAASLSFIPSRRGLITDAQSVKWRIYKVEERNNARDYELFAELMA